MNLLAPVARPAFPWNHHELMRTWGDSLARRLGADLVLPETPPRPAPTARLVIVGAAVAAVAALGWRKLASSRRG